MFEDVEFCLEETKESMQRIYGISFPSQKELDGWENIRQEAEKRSHIKLGKELDLFSMQNEAPGAVFFHSNGTTIWNELVSFAREKHGKAKSPNSEDGGVSIRLIISSSFFFSSFARIFAINSFMSIWGEKRLIKLFKIRREI